MLPSGLRPGRIRRNGRRPHLFLGEGGCGRAAPAHHAHRATAANAKAAAPSPRRVARASARATGKEDPLASARRRALHEVVRRDLFRPAPLDARRGQTLNIFHSQVDCLRDKRRWAALRLRMVAAIAWQRGDPLGEKVSDTATAPSQPLIYETQLARRSLPEVARPEQRPAGAVVRLEAGVVEVHFHGDVGAEFAHVGGAELREDVGRAEGIR